MDFKKIKCFVLDMDGTIYPDNELFDFTLPFLQKVRRRTSTNLRGSASTFSPNK